MYTKFHTFWFVYLNFLTQSSIGQGVDDYHTQAPLEVNEPSYLRVIMGNGTQHYFRNYECPAGVWVDEMFLKDPPKCVCVKGVFAISSNLCDEGFEILTGDEHCFPVENLNLRKFFTLTGKFGMRYRVTTFFRKDAPYFARFEEEISDPYVPDNQQYVFRMNDPTWLSAYQRNKDGLIRLNCFPPQTISSTPIMQIAYLPNCANQFHRERPWCSSKVLSYDWTLAVGQSWNQSSNLQLTQRCSSGAN